MSIALQKLVLLWTLKVHFGLPVPPLAGLEIILSDSFVYFKTLKVLYFKMKCSFVTGVVC